MSLVIEDFSIKGLRIKIPIMVKIEAINPSNDKNSWSKPKTSISNQLPPWPTPGIALNMNIIIAVPSIIFFALASNSFDNLNSKNKIIMNEPIKTISCERAILEVPTIRINITKNIEPIIINKFGLVTSGILNIIFAAFTGLIPLLISNLYLFCWLKYDKNIPDTDIIGTIKEYRSEERRVGKECRSRWSPYH